MKSSSIKPTANAILLRESIFLMTYSIKRIGIKSVAKAAFVCMIIVMVPLLPAILLATAPPYFGIDEPSLGPKFGALISALGVLLFYGVFAAIGASILALVYNLSVRLHGGINIDIDLQEAPPPEKKKN